MVEGIPLDGPVDLDRLHAYLMSDDAPDNALSISEVDGLLTAVVVGPQVIMPSEWLPAVWGGDKPEFHDMAEAEAIMGALMGRYNEIVHGLGADPPSLAPLFWRVPKGKVLVADWCAGFLDGVKLRRQAWASLIRDKDAGVLMAPFVTFGGEPEDRALFGLRGDPPSDRERLRLMKTAPDLLVDCVFAIQDYWRGRQGRSRTVTGVPKGVAETSRVPQRRPRAEPTRSRRSTASTTPPTALGTATHVLRVTLKPRLYREIEIVGTASLYKLAETIVWAFGFDFDHAFGFFTKLTGNIWKSPVRYELFADAAAGSNSRSVKSTAVGQVFRRIGDKMLFLYDYGDEWRFKVEFVGLGNKEPKTGYPRVVASVGTAPEQYPDIEEDDEGDE
jgi:yecA family protein